MTDDQPESETIRAWLAKWEAIRRQYYQQLVDSYTPEQKQIITAMTQAARQVQTCRARLKRRTPYGPHKRKLAWPLPPPEDQP